MTKSELESIERDEARAASSHYAPFLYRRTPPRIEAPRIEIPTEGTCYHPTEEACAAFIEGLNQVIPGNLEATATAHQIITRYGQHTHEISWVISHRTGGAS